MDKGENDLKIVNFSNVLLKTTIISMHMALFCVPNMSYNICDKCRVSEHKQMSSTHKKINQGVVNINII